MFWYQTINWIEETNDPSLALMSHGYQTCSYNVILHAYQTNKQTIIQKLYPIFLIQLISSLLWIHLFN